MRSDRSGWTRLPIGSVTSEVTERLGTAEGVRRVYGVDREVGLTTAAKYMANDLTRYKRVSPGMFVYNPMRLNIGSIGYCSRAFEPGLTSPDYVVFRCNDSQLDPDFLRYLVQGSEWKAWTEAAGIGSVRVRIYYRELSRMPITLPPFGVQRSIAATLGAVDEKIELNRRMNETLEAMARAIFRSWFIDFDPVRAKAEGRHPSGVEKETAALFSSGFQESSFGLTPLGWQASNVGQEFRVTMGQSPPGETYNKLGAGVTFFQGSSDFGFRYPTPRVHCTSPTRFAEAGDTLVSVRAPIGDVNLARERCCIGRGVAAVRHNSGSRSFTLYSMRALRESFLNFEGEGTVFGSVSKADFARIKRVSPPERIVAAFERKIFPIDELIQANDDVSRTLIALRDALLPKLLSGEVRVGDASLGIK